MRNCELAKMEVKYFKNGDLGVVWILSSHRNPSDFLNTMVQMASENS